MKLKITLLSVLFATFSLYTHAQTNCSGSATAAMSTACLGDTIQLTGTVSSAGNALDFNGVNDYVNVSKKLNPGTDITISAWINTTMVIPNRGDIVTSLGPGALGYSLNLNASTPKKVGFWVGDVGGGYLFSSTSVNDGNWHHVAGTYNSTTGMASIYVDGVLDATAPRVGSLYSDTTMRIGDCGGFGCPGYEFDGKIDEVRIWNVARNAAQIQADMNKVISTSSPGLLAYYRFDEGTGTMAADLTGNGYNGVLSSSGFRNTPSDAPIYPDLFYWSPSTDISDTLSLTPEVYINSLPVTYTLFYNDFTTGCSGSASTTIEKFFDPVITSDIPLAQCDPFSINLSTGSASVYAWSDGSTTQNINVTTGGWYKVTVTNGSGCSVTSDSVKVRRVLQRQLTSDYCNRYNYWLTDEIRTQKGNGMEDFDWEFVDINNTNDTIRHTSPDFTLNLSDVTSPPLAAATTYNVRVRLKIDGDFACFGPVCQIGITATQGAGIGTIKLNSRSCNMVIFNQNNVRAEQLTTGSGTANAYEFSLYSDPGCTNLIQTVVKENNQRFLLFSDITGFQTNTTYWCLVRGRVNFQWSAYGDTCYFTTPPSLTVNTTKLRSQNCNQTIPTIKPWLICNEARQTISPYTVADAYAFSIYTDSLCTNLLDSIFVNSTNRRVRLININGLATSTKYWALCYGRVNGDFTSLAKGDTCSFTTPPTFRLTSNFETINLDIAAYPNPFDNTINISFSSEDIDGSAILIVYDLTGREVYRKENLVAGSIETFGNELNPGVYVAEVRQNENSVKIKIVKSR